MQWEQFEFKAMGGPCMLVELDTVRTNIQQSHQARIQEKYLHLQHFVHGSQ